MPPQKLEMMNRDAAQIAVATDERIRALLQAPVGESTKKAATLCAPDLH